MYYHALMIAQDGTIRHLRKSMDLENHAHELTFSCYKKYKLLSKDRTRHGSLTHSIEHATSWTFICGLT